MGGNAYGSVCIIILHEHVDVCRSISVPTPLFGRCNYSMRHKKGYTPLVTVVPNVSSTLTGSKVGPTGADGPLLSSINGTDGVFVFVCIYYMNN